MERSRGSLPRNAETNRREQLKAIALRSGQELEGKLPTEETAEIPLEKLKDKVQHKEKEVATFEERLRSSLTSTFEERPNR